MSAIGASLILGPPAIAEMLAEEFESLGIRAQVHEKTRASGPLSLLEGPDGLTALREVLEKFASNPAKMVHPGTSFWSERPELVHICQDLGLSLVGPTARVVSLFGNKLNLIGEADRIGIPHLVSSFNPIHSRRELESAIEQGGLHLPLLLKSVRGRGDSGSFLLREQDDLRQNISLWFSQLQNNLGEVLVFPERYIEGARFVVVPFARFRNGYCHIFPVVDSSLQSRFRKIIEFCPATGIEPDATKWLEQTTERLANQCAYVGVGFLEFMVDGSRGFLVGGSSRLNTGFRLWEKLARTNVVAWQLAILRDDVPPELPPSGTLPTPQFSSGLAVRFCAEDPLLQLPQAGTVSELLEGRTWRNGAGEGDLRLNLGKDCVVDPMGDPMLGILFVHAQSPASAIAMAHRILNEIWIAGSLQTNERFVAELLHHPWVREGMFHAHFVDEEFVPAIRPSLEVAGVRVGLFASLCAWLLQQEGALTANAVTAPPRVWSVGDEWVKANLSDIHWASRPSLWKRDGMSGVSGYLAHASTNKPPIRVCCYPVLPFRWQVRIGVWVFVVRHLSKTIAASKGPRRKLFSLVNGRVHSILFRENTQVPAHTPLLVLESLRSLIPHTLPTDVRILSWKVKPEAYVSVGQELAEFENFSG